MPHSAKELRLVSPVELTLEAAGAGGEERPALVHVAAYSGGLMNVAGFGPVVIDIEGIETPERVPLLADHENRIDAVLGSGTPSRADGRLSVDGTLSRTSERARRVIELHRDGVPLQASVGAEPIDTERIAKGRQAVVNGRTVRADAASFLLVRRSRLKHVAIVPNGADGGTSIDIAAQAASPSKEKRDMEFTQWIEAQGFVADDLDEKQTACLRAMYDAQTSGNGSPLATAGKDVTATAVADLRAELAAETARVAAIRKLCAGKHPDIEAQAIREGWDATKTELAVIREERPKAPAIHAGGGDGGLVAAEVIEAALCGTLNTPGREKHFSEQTLEAADKNYRRLGLQELILMAAHAGGYTGRATISRETLPEIFRAAFAPMNAAFSTLSLPGIFSNVANKELLAGFMEEDQTWREVSVTRTVSDFKTVTSYRLLDDMEYEELAPDGEIKHGKLSEESYTRQARTYAKMFSLTRTAIINDDLGAFEDLRVRLAELFPRHIQIHYGHYRREELFEAARRSRACAYLADDDHGPLALQEVLLAGCPTVGVRTGASFVRDGVTGFVVERLPPGRQCVAGDEDEAALAIYLDALRQAQSLNRRNVRDQAGMEFGTASIVEAIIGALDGARADGVTTTKPVRSARRGAGPSVTAVVSGRPPDTLGGVSS